MEALRDLEREKFTWKVRHQELSSMLELVFIRETNLKGRKEAFENELKEGTALIGDKILAYKNYVLEPARNASHSDAGGENDDKTTQDELKKKN